MIKIHTREQVMYQLDIGSGHLFFSKSHPAMKKLALDVSNIVGGCTLIDGQGFWADVERANKDDYFSNDIGVENNVQLQVKAEILKESKLEETIVKSVVQIAKEYPQLHINWVCGHKVLSDGTIVAFNFSVEENKNI